jgi:hypothetical protein
MSALYSIAGNPIAIAHPSCTANDLHPYATLIAKTGFPRFEKTQGCPESQYFRVKLEHVPLTRDNGSHISPTKVEHEIAALCRIPQLHTPTRGMRAHIREQDPATSQRLSSPHFWSSTRCSTMLQRSTIFILGFQYKTFQYEEHATKRNSKTTLTQPNDNPLPRRPLADNEIEVDDDNICNSPPLLRSARQ